MIKPFNYHKPANLEDAAALLAQGGTALAGGMTLLPTMKQRLNAPQEVVDLSAIAELREVSLHERAGLVIGAMVTHAQVAAHPLVHEHLPALAHLAGGIGDAQVRHRGTIGGSLANNDPAADYPAALLALGGEVHTNKRKISAEEYFQGLFATALEEGEVVRHLHFPVPVEAACYVKFPQPASLYALVGVFVAKRSDGVRVAVTGAGADGVFRATALEEKLSQDYSAAAIDGVQVSADDLISDLHGDAAYRAALITTLTKRALA